MDALVCESRRIASTEPLQDMSSMLYWRRMRVSSSPIERVAHSSNGAFLESSSSATKHVASKHVKCAAVSTSLCAGHFTKASTHLHKRFRTPFTPRSATRDHMVRRMRCRKIILRTETRDSRSFHGTPIQIASEAPRCHC